MNQAKGVLYFCAGDKHAVHLITAIMSLREWYGGPVAIVTEEDGPGRRVAEAIAADYRISMDQVQVISSDRMQAGGHGVSYLCKTLLPRFSPFTQTIFLDADTVVVGPLDDLWADPAIGEVVLTQFCDWVSTGSKMKGRIAAWKDCCPKHVERMLATDWPAINTGVMAWTDQSESFAEDWHHTSAKNVSFMTDELAAQLIFPDHPVRIADARFNASVVFDADRGLQDVRVWHGHGLKFWKRDNGRAIYLPFLRRAWEHDFAGINGMMPPAKCLRYLEEAGYSWGRDG